MTWLSGSLSFPLAPRPYRLLTLDFRLRTLDFGLWTLDWLIRRQPSRILDPLDNELLPLRPRMNAIAGAQSFGQQMPQVTFPGEMLGRMEHREVQFLELELQVAFVRYLDGVPHSFRHLAESGSHLLRGAQVQLLLGVTGAHPLRVAQQSLRADAHQAIVRVRMTFLDVVHVICRHQV